MITAEIRAWTRHSTSDGVIFWGDIYNDSKGRWKDGQTFHTSLVVEEQDNGDHIIVTTLNSVYKLVKAESLQALLGGPVGG